MGLLLKYGNANINWCLGGRAVYVDGSWSKGCRFEPQRSNWASKLTSLHRDMHAGFRDCCF